MVGGINGDYVFKNHGSVGDDPTLPVNFGYGDATIETNKGTLLWHEDSALDLVNEDAYSTVVLATVTAGTGAWAGAHGHVTMTGYFHASTMTGEFDYHGSVCTGPATQNLIVNGGAEAGAGGDDTTVIPAPGWTTSGTFTVVDYVLGEAKFGVGGSPGRIRRVLPTGEPTSSPAAQTAQLRLQRRRSTCTRTRE